ncbi:MAG TPA: AmmeMemoRadiSam system radical SAM enzyme [Planctomycetota bacterium]|nr:AmmeMemoRadiSam system radical SAM enzyme [Planctomycetota bacterium]
MHEALFYEKTADGRVDCRLCPHGCSGLAEGKTGICRVRKNVDGRLVSLVYGEVTSVNLDPVEKKPLYHFHPGRDILSIGTWGCNFHCAFCQNWQISQQEVTTQSVSVERVLRLAGENGSIGVAYTYNEPSIWYEFVLDCAQRVHAAGLKNVLVTNGFINAEPAAKWLPFIDALNIDIKSMDDAFYREQTGGRLEPVLAAAVQAREQAHVEVTNLVIPTLNDTDDHFARLATWMAAELGKETPLHLSAYSPRYRLKIGATRLETLERAHTVCSEHLDYVYLGNVSSSVGRDTFCTSCGTALVSRFGYRVDLKNLEGPNCGRCGVPAHIVTD